MFRRLESISQAEEQTPEADERDVLVTIVEAYENKHYDFGPVDPIEAIKFRMEQQGLAPRDLEPLHPTERAGLPRCSTAAAELVRGQAAVQRSEDSLWEFARRSLNRPGLREQSNL